jgi:hypothetical protein
MGEAVTASPWLCRVRTALPCSKRKMVWATAGGGKALGAWTPHRSPVLCPPLGRHDQGAAGCPLPPLSVGVTRGPRGSRYGI